MSEADETALRCVATDCHAVLPLGARFCPRCGHDINDQQARKSDARINALRRSPSLSEPAFVESCEVYALALERSVTKHDRALAVVARDLARAFRGFAEQPPSEEVKIAALSKYIDLQRAALERLGRR